MKKLLTSLSLTGLLLSIVFYLVISLFFNNFHDKWEDGGYKVIKVIDGDTIEVQGRVSSFRVRYIGIDTPETAKPNQKEECYAEEALKANKQFVENKTVYLEIDKEPQDRYGRELRYVYIKENNELTMVNYLLIKDGYAKSLKIAPNTKNADEIKRMENEAKLNKIGLWGKCTT